RCACCEGPLEPVQQLRFLVETDNLDDPAFLARIRSMPAVNGRPVPVCKACQALLEEHAVSPQPQPKTNAGGSCPARAKVPHLPNLLGMLGALSVGFVLGSLFASRG